jgi:RNA polymerase sigma factor (sigma-70 family)
MQLKFTDDEYLEGIRADNDMALKSLYRYLYPVISNMVLKNSGSEAEAKDIFQESLIIFIEKVKNGFRPDCQVRTFVYSIARRLWLKRLAEKSRMFGGIEEMEEFLPCEVEISEEEFSQKEMVKLTEALSRIGEPCRSLLTDFYINSLGLEELTVKFRYTNKDNTKNQKYKCLQRLKKIFFTN